VRWYRFSIVWRLRENGSPLRDGSIENVRSVRLCVLVASRKRAMKVSLSGTSKYSFCNLARGLRSKRCIVEIYTLHNGRSLPFATSSNRSTYVWLQSTKEKLFSEDTGDWGGFLLFALFGMKSDSRKLGKACASSLHDDAPTYSSSILLRLRTACPRPKPSDARSWDTCKTLSECMCCNLTNVSPGYSPSGTTTDLRVHGYRASPPFERIYIICVWANPAAPGGLQG